MKAYTFEEPHFVDSEDCMGAPVKYWRVFAKGPTGEYISGCGDTPDAAKSKCRLNIESIPEKFPSSLNEYAAACHAAAKNWWIHPITKEPIERNKGELIALMHSELSEMLEGVRKNIPDDKLPEFPMEHVELVDCLIRCFDYAGAYGIDLETIYRRKMTFNATRPDHQHENRVKDGGKAF